MKAATMDLRLPALGLLLLLSGASAAVPAKLEHIGSHWDAYGNFLSVFRLTNTSEREISFPGYSSSSPVYTRQLRRFGGWRDDKDSGWCGVGLGTGRLAAHQSATFTELPPGGRRTWRIGIEITHPGEQSQVAWTDPLTTDSEIIRQTPIAAELVRTRVVHHPGREFPYTFTLTNISDRPLFYGGFREAHVPPIYLNQERRSGRWVDNGSVNWCGSDFGFKNLRPGDSISFSLPAQSLDATWRIGVRLYRTPRPIAVTDAFSPVWWPPLPPRNDDEVARTHTRASP